jgi:hypothetical protein
VLDCIGCQLVYDQRKWHGDIVGQFNLIGLERNSGSCREALLGRFADRFQELGGVEVLGAALTVKNALG